jgi:hypothetical protein
MLNGEGAQGAHAFVDQSEVGGKMAGILWAIIVILFFFWLIGFLLHFGGGLIHLLLVIVLILVVVNLLTGRGLRV